MPRVPKLKSAKSRNWFSVKLSRRLLIWFAAFSIVPLIITNTVGYIESERIIESLVFKYLHALAEVEARHVRDQIERQEMALSVLTAGNEFLAAGAIQMAGGDAGEMGDVASHAAVQEYFRDKIADLHDVDALRLYAADGRVLVTAMREGELRPDVPGSAKAGFFVLPSRSAREAPRFHVVAPIRRDGKAVGFLGALISARTLHSFLEIPPHLAGSVHSIIVDELGRPIFVSDTNTVVDYMRPHPISITPGDSAAHAHYHDRWGRAMIASSALVQGTPWTFVTEMPESAALGALRTLRSTSAILEIVLILLLAVTAVLVARSVVNPVGKLVDATRKVAGGDLSARVAVRENDEIGELGRAFNDMTSALEQTSARVKQLHQQQIERAQQLATVGELAAGVAHEIKNPVVGISNGLDLVKRRIGPDEAIAPIMDEMQRQIIRIDAAVKDLLSFARPSAPSLSPTLGNLVVERAMRLVAPAADKAGITVEVSCEPHLPAVMLDEELITQALVNVLMNAVQATPPGGRITVQARTSASALLLSVSDTGRGITEDDLEHIYKPFFTTRHSGTGLGLSITRESVERHGGHIDVQSRIGRGTTFTITLPLERVAEPAHQENEVMV